MDAKEIASLLDGMEYRSNIPKDILINASKAGLVILYGASDDLLELKGAISDEVGASEIRIDSHGIVPEFNYIDKDDKEALRDYFRREHSGKIVTPVWGEGPYSWQYRTDIPHETFRILEDGEPYCLGIVFLLRNCE